MHGAPSHGFTGKLTADDHRRFTGQPRPDPDFLPDLVAQLDSNHPTPNTVISSRDLANGTWSPIYEPEWS